MAKKDSREENSQQPPGAPLPDDLAPAIDARATDAAVVAEPACRTTQPGPIAVENAGGRPFLVQSFADQPPLRVSLQGAAGELSDEKELWSWINDRTDAISFGRYQAFIQQALCHKLGSSEPEKRATAQIDRAKAELLPPQFHGVDSYELLKTATKLFLVLNCGIRSEAVPASGGGPSGKLGQYLSETDRRWLPYFDTVLHNLLGDNYDQQIPPEPYPDSPFCSTLIAGRVTDPCFLELIWSFWNESGMLVQTLNTISLRFQNKRLAGHDPLAQLELDPLRPLSNILWGYVQDEHNRLTLPRRAYEYEHHYGISIEGKAVPQLRPADRRSKFLEAFHHLLNQTAQFYRIDADTTVISDGFPVLSALQEVHLLLAEGAHNQYGDLPWTARVEMLIQQWILARPEMREFLRGRHMVPYREPWMGAVDAMKKLKGWSDTPVTYFRDLAVIGEKLLLSVRFGDWTGVIEEKHAKGWARYWKSYVQSYIHAYRTATGVDLAGTGTVDFTPPAVHLRNRLARTA
jgi:hypothetical protein